jgi:RNA polymerase sigma-70 factor, ECF subfamily
MDERDLVRRSQAGDLQAFEILVREKRNQVFRIARQILGDEEEAKDIAQLVFIRLWQTLGRFREGSSFNAWLHRITVNLAIDASRRRQGRGRVEAKEPAVLESAPSPTGTDGAEMARGEVQRVFQQLAARLSPRQRAAFVLREIEGFSTEEVSEMLGMRISTVRNHVHAARRTLQEGLRRLFPEYARRRSGGAS